MFPVYLYLITLLLAPQEWVAPFIGWPTDYIVLTLMLIAVIAKGRLSEFLRFLPHDWLLLLLIVWIGLGAAANGGSAASTRQFIFYIKCFLLFKFIVALVHDFTGARKFFNAYVLLVLVLAVEAIQQKYSLTGAGWANQGRSWIDPDVLKAGGVGRSRWIGIFDGPGVFCVVFTTALPIFLQDLARGVPTGRKVLAAAGALIILWATYCTGSRGGLVASVAVIGLQIMLAAKISLRTVLVVVGLAIAIYMIAPAYLTTIRDSSNSTQYRVEMWAAGMDMLKQHPLLGVGSGNFAAVSYSLIAHNSAVQMVAETGAVGLFLWLALIFVSMKALIAYAQASGSVPEQRFCRALNLSIAGYMISSMFVTLEYETFYVLLAICAVFAHRAAVPMKLGLHDLLSVAAIEVVLLATLQIFVIIYIGW
jgi:O-antigen ligase